MRTIREALRGLFTPEPRPVIRLRWRSLAILAVTLCLFGHPGVPIRTHLDTVRDQLRLRDCVERGICTGLESTAQHENLFHGPVWMQFLIATRRAGFDPWEQRRAVIALLGIAAAVVELWVSGTFSPGMGILAAVIFVGLSLRWTEGNLLYNPAVLALPCSLFYLGLSGLLAFGSAWWAALAALSLSLCIDVHVAGLAFIPLLATAAVLAPGRSWALLAAATGALCISAAALSASVWVNNLRSLQVSVPILIASVCAVVAAAAIRKWWLARTPIIRLAFFNIGVGAYFLLGVTVLANARGWTPHSNYFLYIAPLAACGGAAVLHSLLRLAHVSSRGLLLAAAVGLLIYTMVADVWVQRGRTDGSYLFTLEDGRRLAQFLEERGWTYSRLRFALRGPGVKEYGGLLAGITPFITKPPDSLVPTPDDQILRIMSISSSELVRFRSLGWDAVPLERERVALIKPLKAWVREARTRILVDGREWNPAPLPPPASIAFADLDRLADAWPLGASGSRNGDVPHGRSMTVELLLQTEPSDALHAVLLISGCTRGVWRIVRLEGVESDGPSDGTSVFMRRGADREAGVIQFRYDKPDGSSLDWMELAALHFVETREGEEVATEYLRHFARNCN
jgi:hypothetical protein